MFWTQILSLGKKRIEQFNFSIGFRNKVAKRPSSLGPNLKTNLKPISCPKKTKSDLKNLAILPSYFDYILVLLRQKALFRPELSPKFLSTLDPNPTRKAGPDLLLCF